MGVFFSLLYYSNSSNGNDGDNVKSLKTEKGDREDNVHRSRDTTYTMSNGRTYPVLNPSDATAMLAHLERTNPQAFAQLQAMRPEQIETAREHLMAAANERGHQHVHSESCRHGPPPMLYSSQPFPEAITPKIPTNEMTIVQAVQHNEMERVKELIESGRESVNAPDREGCYLLHWASINNHVEIVRYLIAKGATVDIKGGDLQSTPLHWACRQGCTETFFVLVDNRAATDSVDVNGIQPIHIAAQYGQIKILAYLLGSGADVDCPDARGFTPLIYSCLGPPPSYVPLPNSTHVCCTQFLLTFGADVNYQEPSRRYSPLHFAINNHNPVSLHVLLKHPHVNISIKNSENCDPFTFARMRNNLDATALFDNRIQSSKANVRPAFLQPFFTKESSRKWMTRFYMLFLMTFIGLTANAYDYPYWIRLLVLAAVVYLSSHLFNYFVFDDHTKDNFAFSYVLSSTLLMYVTYILYFQHNQWTLATICYHVFSVYGIYCIRCIKKVNPGFLKHQTMTLDGHGLSKEKICIAFARDPRWTLDHFCVTCLIRRPLRSKHCPVDGSCVMKFDHHCAWLDACIGGRNYFYFIRVITFGTVALWIWFYRAIRVISTDAEQYTVKYLFLEQYDPWFNYMMFITTFNIFWVTLMTIFHLYNSIVLGVTLNERLTGFRYSYFRDENTGTFHNPFRHAFCKNFLETFGLFRLMAFFRYTRVDWSQIYDINQIRGPKST